MKATDDEMEQWLREADKTAVGNPPRLDELLQQLQRVSALTASAGRQVTEPSLLVEDRAKQVTVRAIGERLSFGRAEACDLAYPGLTDVSRLHFEIHREGEDFILKDAGSVNGTFINRRAERVTTHRLRDGDVIGAAGFTFAFVRP